MTVETVNLVAAGSSEAVLPDDKLAEPFDGGMTAELLWGLFETAVRLDDDDERKIFAPVERIWSGF